MTIIPKARDQERPLLDYTEPKQIPWPSVNPGGTRALIPWLRLHDRICLTSINHSELVSFVEVPYLVFAGNCGVGGRGRSFPLCDSCAHYLGVSFCVKTVKGEIQFSSERSDHSSSVMMHQLVFNRNK